ncbi:uncharacterized protein [Polyergus mexicanus]|uniref:uncharacterized protein n=1 Tax=Polyergus mexicanus TaxID=615972 RepID=UPI0038B6456E
MTNYDDKNSTSQNLSSKLRSWIIEEQIPHKSGNALLKILRDYGHNSLPKDIRTLMQTQRKASQQIEKIDNGSYMIEIHRNRVLYNGKICKVSIAGIVCDAPARAFITCTKSHSGYFSCHKCTQEGEYVNFVIFPELKFTLRTNESFHTKEQEEHHTGVSFLEKFGIDMVNQIALDYMHLVCLGIMKRLLLFWIKGSKNIRLNTEHQKYICNTLSVVRSSIPSEFARLPRSLSELDRWKATEFRLFLLYIGPVILKSTMSNEYYTHFLTLSIAIRILCDSQLCIKMNNYAHNLLVYFVDNYKNLYGREYMSYNVHNLLHLANDVKTLGSLDKFSCFQFENYLRNIRRKVQ